MGQPDIQQLFSGVSVEGFDQIYQPDAPQSPVAPDQAQTDPVVEVEIGQDQAQGDPSQGISLEDAAKVLSLHIDTVRKRLQKGKIKGFKVADKFGDKWLVYKDEVDRLRRVQPHPILQAQVAPDQARTDPVVGAEIGPEQAQGDPATVTQADSHLGAPANLERERLMAIIESQAHQLKAAGDVIVYLKSELEDSKMQLKLLTDSQHKAGWWARFCSWFVDR